MLCPFSCTASFSSPGPCSKLLFDLRSCLSSWPSPPSADCAPFPNCGNSTRYPTPSTWFSTLVYESVLFSPSTPSIFFSSFSSDLCGHFLLFFPPRLLQPTEKLSPKMLDFLCHGVTFPWPWGYQSLTTFFFAETGPPPPTFLRIGETHFFPLL